MSQPTGANTAAQQAAEDLIAAPTRPAVASRKARRPKTPRSVVRFTLDLARPTHSYLRLFALSNDVEASRVCRALLYLLEADETLRERVLNEIFADEDEGDGDTEADPAA